MKVKRTPNPDARVPTLLTVRQVQERLGAIWGRHVKEATVRSAIRDERLRPDFVTEATLLFLESTIEQFARTPQPRRGRPLGYSPKTGMIRRSPEEPSADRLAGAWA